MSKGKYLLIGFVVGGTISAAATLLTTPSSGREIRGQVKEQSLELAKIAEGIMQDAVKLKDQIAKTSVEGVAIITELTQDLKKSIEEWKGAVAPSKESIQSYLEQIESSLKELEEKINTKSNNNES